MVEVKEKTSGISVKTPREICPYCRDEVAEHQPQLVCKRCLTRHHPECWAELGHCSVHACGCEVYLTEGGSAPPTHALERRQPTIPLIAPDDREPTEYGPSPLPFVAPHLLTVTTERPVTILGQPPLTESDEPQTTVPGDPGLRRQSAADARATWGLGFVIVAVLWIVALIAAGSAGEGAFVVPILLGLSGAALFFFGGRSSRGSDQPS